LPDGHPVSSRACMRACTFLPGRVLAREMATARAPLPHRHTRACGRLSVPSFSPETSPLDTTAPATAYRSPATTSSAAPVRGGPPRRHTTQTRALVDAHDADHRVPSLAHDVQNPHTARRDATWSHHGSAGGGGCRQGPEAGVALMRCASGHATGAVTGDMHRASARGDARPLGRRDATAPRAAGALAGLLCPEPLSARRSLPCCGGHRGVSPPRVHAPRLWSRRSSL
jgi:hypothetical protein